MGRRYGDLLDMGRRDHVLTVHGYSGRKDGILTGHWQKALCAILRTREGEMYCHDMGRQGKALTGDGQKRWCTDWTWTG